jgi:hypothetical protein
MHALTMKIITGCAAVAVGVVALVSVERFVRAPSPSTPSAVAPAVIVPHEVIHTSAWYLAHRDALKVDEGRCAGDAASIAPLACRNVNEAVQDVDQANVQNLLQQDLNSSK